MVAYFFGPPCKADWAAWMCGTCQMGQLVRRPGGPPRQML